MKKNTVIDKGKIILYKNRVEVRLEAETVWLTSHQIADLFGVDRTGVVRHIHNIYKTKELRKISTCAKNAQVAKDGKIRAMDFYNLDMIISVGYKVNSTRATQFRVWATDILKKHLIEGYTINEKRLKLSQTKYQELQKAVDLIGNVLEIKDLPAEARGLVKIITEYTRALDILDDFDHQRLSKPKGTKRLRYKLTYDKAMIIVDTMKKRFNSSDIMGREKDEGFKGSIGAIYQTFGDKDLYPSVEEKAAHLLYFITKNHSFVDGNKRIAAAIFIYFLDRNNVLNRKDGSHIIDDNALIALTLMIASSKPLEKDIMVKVILNILGR